MALRDVTLRQGLPRSSGGEPWPTPRVLQVDGLFSIVSNASSTTNTSLTTDTPLTIALGESALRRGLPRLAGGNPWPPAGFAPVLSALAGTGAAPLQACDSAVANEPAEATGSGSTDAPKRRKIMPPVPQEPRRIGPFTVPQWLGAGAFGAVTIFTCVAGVVAITAWLMSLAQVQAFIARYPGALELPESAPIGIPAWLGWQHFCNMFLLVLIIRSGIQIRREQRPSGYWAPKRNPERKVSMTIWFHQSLDILWMANGIIFIVLLFATGQWMKIVPMSWEVFPHALSAGLQYLSLDWPTENGWIHYNALQQVSYFLTVFIAAPLAALTGVRMSGLWPQKAPLLSRMYPIELARKIHFPVMIYFIAFIVVHVALVFATGALRNLNHMYAAQGSVDPNVYAHNWSGFWIFTASLAVVLGAVVAARPVVVAPIARLFGTVSSR